MRAAVAYHQLGYQLLRPDRVGVGKGSELPQFLGGDLPLFSRLRVLRLIPGPRAHQFESAVLVKVTTVRVRHHFRKVPPVPSLFDAADLHRPAREVARGVVHLPGTLDLTQQEQLVNQAREIARSVAGTPVAMQQPLVGTGRMSVHVLPLGRFWQTRPYRLVREVAGHPVPAVPDNYQRLAEQALRRAAEISPELRPWATGFRAENALVNYYGPDATMGMHVDADETSSAPVISLSIGDTAIFRLGNTEHRNRPWVDTALLSGDVIVFGGPARRAYHGVPVVQAATAPENCGLREGRINITIRQVEP